MIINPSPLIQLHTPTNSHEKRLQELYGDPEAKWDYVKLNHASLGGWHCACYCRACTPKRSVGPLGNVEGIESLWSVTLTPEVFLGGSPEQVKFWFGKCTRCGAISWSCDNWVWVSWLSDFETVDMLLKATPIKCSVFGVKNIKRTTLFMPTELVFENGELVEARVR